jgi:hypothetical protein
MSGLTTCFNVFLNFGIIIATWFITQQSTHLIRIIDAYMRNEGNRLIRPLAFCAIVSVATFSGIGIAAITGQLSVGSDTGELFRRAAGQDSGEVVKEGAAEPAFVPTHIGLTRSAVSGAEANLKQTDQRDRRHLTQNSKSACDRCGVVQSIERHDLQMPNMRTHIGPFEVNVENSDPSDERFPVSMLAGSNRNSYDANNRKYEGETSFIIRLQMEDGSLRTIYEHQLPKFSIGQKVRLVNGAVVSVG